MYLLAYCCRVDTEFLFGNSAVGIQEAAKNSLLRPILTEAGPYYYCARVEGCNTRCKLVAKSVAIEHLNGTAVGIRCAGISPSENIPSIGPHELIPFTPGDCESAV